MEERGINPYTGEERMMTDRDYLGDEDMVPSSKGSFHIHVVTLPPGWKWYNEIGGVKIPRPEQVW